MIIICSKYNEVRLQDIKDLIKPQSGIRRNHYCMGCYLGSVDLDGVSYPFFSGDEVCINNVWLSLVDADDSYFDHELIINDFDYMDVQNV